MCVPIANNGAGKNVCKHDMSFIRENEFWEYGEKIDEIVKCLRYN